MLCSEFQLVKAGDGYTDYKPLPCNRWSCDHCAPKRRRALMALAASGMPNKVLTLTVSNSIGGSPLDRRNLLHDAWKRLVKRIIRRFKFKAVHYMAFLEATKKGEPHLHILLRCPFIPQKWISAQMREMIGAPIVWIEKIHSTKQAIRYLTKYVTKAPAQFGCTKRYWVSRNYEVNKGDQQARPVFDMRGIRVVRDRWSETINFARYNTQSVDVMIDGWYRFWEPRSWAAAEAAHERANEAWLLHV